MARAALKFFFSNSFLVALFLFWLLLSFFLPCVCVCQCFLCGAVFLCQCFLCVCVCVCVCWCWVGLKRKQTFFLCWVGITIFPMVLSHPSGTLEKKRKKVKEKREKKEKKKKKMPLGAKWKEKTRWVSWRKRTIGVCVFFFSFGPEAKWKEKRIGFLEGSERSAFAFFSFHLASVAQAFLVSFLVSTLPCSSNIREPELPQPLYQCLR